MKTPGKTLGRAATVLGVALIVLCGLSIYPLKKVGEFAAAEEVKGYWATLQVFLNKNGRYPKDEEEIGSFFHVSPNQLRLEPVEYLAPRGTNADEVILWRKKKTMFGVRVGVTESGAIVEQ